MVFVRGEILSRKVNRVTWAGIRTAAWVLLASVQVNVAGAAGPELDFVHIPAGAFVMGNTDFDESVLELPDGDAGLIEDERPARRVRITRGFDLQRTEVTQAQWLSVMHTRPGPAEYWKRKGWAQLPVVSVSWHDAQRFMAALNRASTGARYRLPTEAEWEYAARAGHAGNRPFPVHQLGSHAWTLENSGDKPHPVAQKQPNAWGLYDMLGNAWEWVADRYQSDYYGQGQNINPTGPRHGDQHVRRGGSYHCQPPLVRVNYRAADTPSTRYSVIGFRVLREII